MRRAERETANARHYGAIAVRYITENPYFHARTGERVCDTDRARSAAYYAAKAAHHARRLSAGKEKK